jgi:hypothetical protein
VPALVAHIAAYRDGAPWLDALRDYLQANMRYVADTLNNAFPALAGSRRRPPTWRGSTCAPSTLTTARYSRR